MPIALAESPVGSAPDDSEVRDRWANYIEATELRDRLDPGDAADVFQALEQGRLADALRRAYEGDGGEGDPTDSDAVAIVTLLITETLGREVPQVVYAPRMREIAASARTGDAESHNVLSATDRAWSALRLRVVAARKLSRLLLLHLAAVFFTHFARAAISPDLLLRMRPAYRPNEDGEPPGSAYTARPRVARGPNAAPPANRWRAELVAALAARGSA